MEKRKNGEYGDGRKEGGWKTDIPPLFHFRLEKDNPAKGIPALLYISLPWARMDPWELSAYLPPFLGYSSSIDTVYDSSVENWLGKRGLRVWWHQHWPYPEYEDYRRKEYARYLLERGADGKKSGANPESGPGEELLRHFLVLGYAPFLPELLEPYLKGMKSLSFLTGREEPELERFVETVYEEYGLAVSCRVPMERRFLVQPECPRPSLILDLSGESRLSPVNVAEGSVWLDMDSCEEKRRRIEGCGRLSYFSMKKEWGRGAKFS